MPTLAWITIVCVAGAALPTLIANVVSVNAPKHWIPALVSFAVGALLGAAFLEVLPHAFEHARSPHTIATTVLAGILVFFILEKLVLWRHCHLDDCEVHGSEDAHEHHHGHSHAAHAAATARGEHGRSGLMILVGDSFHNFVDGVLIAAAFIESVPLGIITASAVIAHEIPQELGDFVILLHSGYTRSRALVLNLASSLAMIVGAFVAYFALQAVREWINILLAFAGSSMIYVAVADLIPGLHRRPELHATLQQITLIALGVLSIWVVGLLTH